MTYPYELWANSHLEVHTMDGEEWRVTCPNPSHPDSNPSCFFNVRKGVWTCFACGHSGGLGNSLIEDTDIQIDLLEFELHNILANDSNDNQEAHTIPESSLSRYNFSTDYWAKKRHLTNEIINMFDLGFDAIANAATIPERTPNGGLIGVTRRFIDSENSARYRYPKGFKKSQNMFGSWIDEDFTEVAILEGAIDAMKVWQVGHPAFGIYGAHLSTYHIQLMNRLGVRKVIWIGDGDKAGRIGVMRSRGLIKTGSGYKYRPELDLSKHFLLYHATDHQGKKDTGAMTDKEVLATIDSQEPFIPDASVEYLKLRTKSRRV